MVATRIVFEHVGAPRRDVWHAEPAVAAPARRPGASRRTPRPQTQARTRTPFRARRTRRCRCRLSSRARGTPLRKRRVRREHVADAHTGAGLQFAGVSVQFGQAGSVDGESGAPQTAKRTSEPRPFWSGTGVIVAGVPRAAPIVLSAALYASVDESSEILAGVGDQVEDQRRVLRLARAAARRRTSVCSLDTVAPPVHLVAAAAHSESSPLALTAAAARYIMMQSWPLADGSPRSNGERSTPSMIRSVGGGTPARARSAGGCRRSQRACAHARRRDRAGQCAMPGSRYPPSRPSSSPLSGWLPWPSPLSGAVVARQEGERVIGDAALRSAAIICPTVRVATASPTGPRAAPQKEALHELGAWMWLNGK